MTVRNGKISNFLRGIQVETSDNVILENLDLSNNLWRAVLFTGRNLKTSDLKALNIDGSKRFPNTLSYAMEIDSIGCQITDTFIGSEEIQHFEQIARVWIKPTSSGCSQSRTKIDDELV